MEEAEIPPREPRSPTPAEDYLLALAQALHAAGTPAHRLEDVLERAASQLGIEGQFYSTPTALMISLGPVGRQQGTLLRVAPAEVNLQRIAALDDVVVDVLEGVVPPAEALARIHTVTRTPPPWGRAVVALGYAVTGGGVARVFGGGAWEMAVAAFIGGVVGMLAVGQVRRPARVRIHEPAAAVAASILAALAVRLGAPVSPFLVTLAGLIVLVPGFTLTVAMTELATRHLVSGTARLTAASVVFLQLAFGVALGTRLTAPLLAGVSLPVPAGLPGWTEPVALVGVSLGLTVVFQASPRRLGWILAISAVAFYGSRLGAGWLGPALGASVGAFLATLAANLYGRLLNRTAFVPLAPALLLLVPGSLGFRSLASLMERDVIHGVDTAFEMTLVAMSIVAGLLAAHAVLSPRRPL